MIEPGTEIPLWKGDAPGAIGDAPADRPHLTPWYSPEPGRARPAVIVNPGGGYNALAPHEGRCVAELLASWGLAAMVLNYRVKPYMLDAALADARRALRLVRHLGPEIGVDPDRVGMLGFSAGGHLAACISTIDEPGDGDDPIDGLSARPDLLIGCYAPVSLPAMGRGDRHGWLLGDDPPSRMLRYIELDRHVTDRSPPTFLWHTAEDTTVPAAQSILMADALTRAQVPVALHIFPRGRHGLGLASESRLAGQWPGLLRDWLVAMDFLAGSISEVGA